MADITIRTNNIPRDVLGWHDLTARERAEFDYLDTDQRRDDAQFIRYRDVAYDLGEFTSLSVTGTPEFKPWDGVHADSHFSGVLIRYYGRNFEQVVCATFSA